MIDHGGNQGTTHDATGDTAGKGDPKGRAWTQPAAGDTRGDLPPRVVRKVAEERSAHRGTQLCIERSDPVVVSPLMRMWYMSLDTSAHCLVSTVSVVVNADDRRAHFVASTHRFAQAREMMCSLGAEARPQRRGPRVPG